MMAASGSLRISPGVAWSVESHGIRLVDELAGRMELLGGPQAVVWDFLVMRGCVDEATPLVACAAGLKETDAAAFVSRCVGTWLQGGWICCETGS